MRGLLLWFFVVTERVLPHVIQLFEGVLAELGNYFLELRLLVEHISPKLPRECVGLLAAFPELTQNLVCLFARRGKETQPDF